MITIKPCNVCGVADERCITFYGVECNGVEYVVFEDPRVDSVGIIHEEDISRTDDDNYYIFFTEHFNANTFWISFLHRGAGGCTEYFDDLKKEYDYDTSECLSDQIDNTYESMKKDCWFKTEDEAFKGRELAAFLVGRYMYPFIEDGFLYDANKGYAPLDKLERGFWLPTQYTSTRAYDEETEHSHEIIPCSEYDPHVVGFHDWCRLYIANGNFCLVICQQIIKLCPVDIDPADMEAEMPAFLVDTELILKHMKEMQEEYFKEEEK